jgi:hypothetical protein
MSEEFVEMADKFLFSRGVAIENYFIEMTPVSEVICYRNSGGREFDLPINDPELYDAVVSRLRALGVRVVRLG